jgi:hypothetical protein
MTTPNGAQITLMPILSVYFKKDNRILKKIIKRKTSKIFFYIINFVRYVQKFVLFGIRIYSV